MRLEELARTAALGGLFLDFDGTLSEIVPRPQDARPVRGVSESLAALARDYAVVAVVSGRPAAWVGRVLDAPGVEVFGLYGLGEAGPGIDRSVVDQAGRLAASEGATVEEKGPSVAVHVRRTADPEAALARLTGPLRELADRHGLRLLPGKMVVELAPDATPGKGAVVRREARARRLAACLYAGDDVADLDAFATLDALAATGIGTIKVAVRSEETPEELLLRADVVVERPTGLVRLLEHLLPGAEPR